MNTEILSGYHLLVAEDSPTNQIIISAILKRLGATFDLASDGEEAIEYFEKSNYDLALLDIEMPVKSGICVTRHIRESDRVSKNFPVIALTAYVLAEHRSKIEAAGVSGIIAKPIVDINKFSETIKSHLDASYERST